MEEPLVATFVEASEFLRRRGGTTLKPDDWQRTGLGSWSLLELVGHANRAHSTIEDYLLRPQPPEEKGSPYFSEEAIASRGRESVLALGNDPSAAVAASSARVCALVRERPLDSVLGSPAGTMSLEDYLPSRIVELIVHGLDVVRAVGGELAVPRAALTESLAFVARRSATRGGEQVLLALTGRGALDPGFSIF